MKKFRIIIATAFVLAVCQVTNAALTISGSVGGAPTGVKHVNFDNLPLGNAGGVATGPDGSVTVSFVTDGQTVVGAVSGGYAAPWLSGNNGIGFGPGGSTQPDGADQTRYLTTGVGQAILTFGSLQQYFGLLWGSVDNYNTLYFYNGASLVGSVTGSQVTGSPNGNQGVNGTLYVNINSTLGFDKVIATSSQYAFEFDNVAYNLTPIPEPGTMVAGALLVLPFAARFVRKNRKA